MIGIRGLVQLGAAGVGGGLAVEQRVARHGPVGLLLPVEQEPGRGARRGQVPVDEQPGERLVQVTGEHLAVGAEVARRAPGEVPGRHRLPPRAGQRRHDRAGVGLVLTGLDHVGGQVVVQDRRAVPLGSRAGRVPERRPQPGVVTQPARHVLHRGQAERLAQRTGRRRHRRRLVAAETQRQGDRVTIDRRDVLGCRDVTVRRRVVGRERVGGIELGEAVAGAARIPDARGRGGGARVQGHVRRHRVVTVDRVGHRVGAVDHRDRGSGGGVDHARVTARVLAAAAAVAVDVRVQPRVQVQTGHAGAGPGQRRKLGVHEHGVPGGIGDVGGDDLVAVPGVGRGHRAGHAGGVGRHRVGHVPGLQVGEGGPVGDDVLQRADVRVVDGRLVGVRQHSARHRVPDLRPRPGRRAHAILAGQVEVGLRARRPGRRARGRRLAPSGGGGAAGGEREHGCERQAARQQRDTRPAEQGHRPHRHLQRNGPNQPGAHAGGAWASRRAIPAERPPATGLCQRRRRPGCPAHPLNRPFPTAVSDCVPP